MLLFFNFSTANRNWPEQLARGPDSSMSKGTPGDEVGEARYANNGGFAG